MATWWCRALPGWASTVDESVVERYPWIPGPWCYFRTDTGRETRAVSSDHSVKWDAESGPGYATI